MKIIIDTKQDSPEEIRRAINMLSAMIGDDVIRTESHLAKAEPEEKHHTGIFGALFGPPKGHDEEKAQEVKYSEEEEVKEFEDIGMDDLETY